MRRFFAVAFSILGVTCLVGATIATTALLTALDKPTVMRVAQRALDDKQIQQRFADEVSVAVLKAMPAVGRSQAAAEVIRQSANQTITEPAFREIALSAASQLYDNAVRGTNTPVYLPADQLTALVRKELAVINPQILSLLPAESELRVELTAANIPDLKATTQWARRAPLILGGAALCFLFLAVAVARRRRRVVRRIGWIVVVVGAMLTGVAFGGPRWGLSLIGPRVGAFSSAITGTGWRLYGPAAALTGLGALLAITGTILAARAPENRITRSGQRAPVAREGQPTVELWDTRV